MTTLTKAELLKLSNEEQIEFFKNPNNTYIDDDETTSDAMPDAAEIFTTEPDVSASSSDEVVTSEYDIEGDSVFLNVDIEIAGQMFRLKGVKLTEKSMCMQNWDKDSKSWADEHTDTMSIIEMIRKHGSNMVTEHAVATARFGMQGERNAVKRDPLTEMLEAQAQAEAEAKAKALALQIRA